MCVSEVCAPGFDRSPLIEQHVAGPFAEQNRSQKSATNMFERFLAKSLGVLIFQTVLDTKLVDFSS